MGWMLLVVLALLVMLGACRSAPEVDPTILSALPSAASADAPRAEPSPQHPAPAASAAMPSQATLPALKAEWMERIELDDTTVVVTPPVGTTVPRSIAVSVHGAGDRPDWSCGGWRLASQASLFVVCPQGSKLSNESFAWASARAIEQRVEAALTAVRARFGPYVADGPMIYIGFSQGANLAEPFLRKNASRFPIAILAEGGYATSQNPAFAKAFRDAGGRRVVLVCGSSSCFVGAARARAGLEKAGLEVLVVGDEKAGHNLNGRMQQALQSAWPKIAAPLAAP